MRNPFLLLIPLVCVAVFVHHLSTKEERGPDQQKTEVSVAQPLAPASATLSPVALPSLIKKEDIVVKEGPVVVKAEPVPTPPVVEPTPASPLAQEPQDTGKVSKFVKEEELKKLPPNAKTALPLLEQVADKYWPNHSAVSLLAAQMTKETCITFKHSTCLTARAQLKTSREWGTGFGQLTIAYNKDGTERFNTIKEVKSYLPELINWDHASDPYNSYFHMIGFVGKMHRMHSTMKLFDTPLENYKGTLVSYNRGYGGLIADRNVCKKTPGCNPNRWTDNVEHTSNMQKTPEPGYGKTFFQISREYPRIVTGQYWDMYRPYFGDSRAAVPDY